MYSEIRIDDVPFMRRISDDYANATQILKIASISSGKGTARALAELKKGEHDGVNAGRDRGMLLADRPPERCEILR